MAKQNVGFGERHLEKLVFGAAGAVLAGVAFMYLVQDPYKLEVGGQSVNPAGFYTQLDEQAQRMQQALKNATVREDP